MLCIKNNATLIANSFAFEFDKNISSSQQKRSITRENYKSQHRKVGIGFYGTPSGNLMLCIKNNATLIANPFAFGFYKKYK